MEPNGSWQQLPGGTRPRRRVPMCGLMCMCALFAFSIVCFTASWPSVRTSTGMTAVVLGSIFPLSSRQTRASLWPLIAQPPRAPLQPQLRVRPASYPLVHRAGSQIVQAEDKEEKASGHQTAKGPEMSPEDMAIINKYRDHQQNAARLSNAEEVRSLIEYSNGYGVLSTNSQQYDGFPTGSVVGFALDEEGYPFMVFSSMSAHTTDVKKDGRISLTVLAKDFQGASEGRCVIIGEIDKLPADKKVAYRDIYLKRHPKAYWIDFGDFTYWKMTKIMSVRFIGGFARAGSITGEEYFSAKPDPVSAFASHVMAHMNADHSEATAAIVQHSMDLSCQNATMVGMDSLGMTVKANMNLPGYAGEVKVRIPWDGGRVTERKAIKDVIVKMTREAAAAMKEAKASD